MGKIYNKSKLIPGYELGFNSIQEVKDFMSLQVRRKGFFFQTVVAGLNEPISLSGDAQFLIGLKLYDDTGDPLNTFEFIINNEQRIEPTSHVFLTSVFGDPAVFQSNPYTEEVFPVPCPLSGNDSMSIKYDVNTAGNLFIVFLYI